MPETIINNAANIALGAPNIGGAVFVAPAQTAIPTDASTLLGAAFKSVGYCTTEGIKEQPTLTTVEIKEWGGSTVLSPVDEHGTKYVIELMETSALTLGIIYGEENVTTEENATIKVVGNPKYRKDHVWVIEELISDTRIQRTVIPRGKITAIGEIAHKRTEVKKYVITVSALVDAAGNDHYDYYAEIDKEETVG